ncbi:hypothetical protein AB0C18_29010 [Nonomuraea muscovyensis]|uniref:hypothetical protein n=1 Tax=Nonomuraea muscovyensis TaxID=1124761 RepID=UPI00340280F7
MPTIRPHHDLQAAARQQAATDPDRQNDHGRRRPMVERAVACWSPAATAACPTAAPQPTTAGSTTAPQLSTSAAWSTWDSPSPATPGPPIRPTHPQGVGTCWSMRMRAAATDRAAGPEGPSVAALA